MIMLHEGYREGVYEDSLGNKTAGYGHMLTGKDPAPHDPIWKNKTFLKNLFESDYQAAVASAIRVVGDNDFQNLQVKAQEIVVDMAFNLGQYRLGQFHRFLAALRRQDYASAAKEMRNSLWARQVKSRALNMARQMEGCRHG